MPKGTNRFRIGSSAYPHSAATKLYAAATRARSTAPTAAAHRMMIQRRRRPEVCSGPHPQGHRAGSRPGSLLIDGQVLPEFVEQRPIQLEGHLHLVDRTIDLLGTEAQCVEPGPVRVFVGLEAHREFIERQSRTVQAEGPVENL